MQQRDGRKCAIDKKIIETRNNKKKTIAIGITTENLSVIAETITGFMNANQDHNKAVNSSRNPHINISNMGKD